MEILFNRNEKCLKYNDKIIVAWNRVRTVKSGNRLLNEVVYTTPSHLPYDPQLFPIGTWNVLGIVAHPKDDGYLYPYFISTDAKQLVKVWETKDGKYVKETDQTVLDMDYGLHFSTSNTTLGCIRVGTEQDLRDLVDVIKTELAKGSKVQIIVG